MRKGRGHHNVCGFLQNFRIGADLDAPRGIACSRNFTQVPACFCRIGVDCADHLDRLLFSHQTHQGRTDGPDAILDGTNLLSHVNSCDSRTAPISLDLAKTSRPDEPTKVKQSPASFNCLTPVAPKPGAAG